MLKDMSYEELLILENSIFEKTIYFFRNNDTEIINEVVEFVKRWPKIALFYANMSRETAIGMLRGRDLTNEIDWILNYPVTTSWDGDTEAPDFEVTKMFMLKDVKSLDLFVFIDSSIYSNPKDIAQELENA